MTIISFLHKTLSMALAVFMLGSLCYGAPVRVFVLAGQSNMSGGGAMDDLPTAPFDLTQPQADIGYHFLIKGPNPNMATDWSPLRPLWPGFTGTTYGPELTFGQRLAEQFPGESVAIIKVAANGTDLQNAWAPNADPPSVYQAMIDHVALAMGQLQAAGDEPVISGFVWVQGSGDASNEAKGTEYEANLNELIASVRADWGMNNLPVVFNQYHVDSSRSSDGIAAVRQSQANVAAADPWAEIVNFDDLTLKSDFIHYTGPTQIELGYRLADAYISLVAVPEPASLLLCCLGVIGLIVGRAMTRRRRQH
jgi:hypothetical protein